MRESFFVFFLGTAACCLYDQPSVKREGPTDWMHIAQASLLDSISYGLIFHGHKKWRKPWEQKMHKKNIILELYKEEHHS